MIKRVFSDLSTFKELEFLPSFNILVVQREPDATQQQTRNRAGKTSLIELIHFLTGSSCGTGSIFRSEALIDNYFGFEIDLGEKVVSIERTGSKPSKLFLINGSTEDWPIQPRKDKKTGRLAIRNADWKSILGSYWFKLDPGDDDDDSPLYKPSFRSLLSYCVRRELTGGFISPFRYSEKQQPGDQQINLLYLLGLDWSLAMEWQIVRDREKMLRELKKASLESAFGAIIGTSAELRTKVAVAEQKVNILSQTVKTYQVLPEYHELESEASELTRKLSGFADGDTVDRHHLSELKKATVSEQPPPSIDIERMYKEIGIAFSEATIRRREEVKQFHESVIQNRKVYLQDEIQIVERRISERAKKMQALDKRRSDIMSILISHGALEQFSKLQAELTKSEADLERLKQQYETAETIEGQRTELNVERGRLSSQLQRDFKEREETLREAILTFEAISNQLYERAGSLTINYSTNGPEFDVSIQGSRSKGIINMQTFCFDLMLMQLCQKRGVGPGFLVHDSHIFDGVDDRQIAKAFEVGAKSAGEYGFQYIVTMNSDVLDTVRPNLPSNFDIDNYIIPTRLSDDTETGGLFGLRFE